MPRPKAKEPRHQLAQLSATTHRIVEKDDPYQQYCQCYVRLAPKAQRCFLIDTGCGLGNLRDYIEENINTQHWPYTVICTHSHFDHIAANHLFKDEQVCFGAADKDFVLKSRGMPMPLYEGGHLGNVVDFPVTQWLQDGELIPLDTAETADPKHSLQVIFTPGHSPDSISLYDPEERRLFCGDFLYPYAEWDDPLSPPGGLYAMCEGSSLSVYHENMLKMQQFVKEHSSPDLPEITLACGHNTYSMDIGFIDSCLSLFTGIEQDKMPSRPRDVFGIKCLEYMFDKDPRASIVLPVDDSLRQAHGQ